MEEEFCETLSSGHKIVVATTKSLPFWLPAQDWTCHRTIMVGVGFLLVCEQFLGAREMSVIFFITIAIKIAHVSVNDILQSGT